MHSLKEPYDFKLLKQSTANTALPDNSLLPLPPFNDRESAQTGFLYRFFGFTKRWGD